MANEEKRYINRLKSRNVVRPLVNKMYGEGVEAAAEGRPVAWCMVNWWEGDLILRAMGVTPVYPENYGTVCASTGIAQKYLERSDAEGFPTHLCGYARNAFGYTAEMKELGEVPPDAPMGGLAPPTFLMSSEGYCDARYKWFQGLKHYLDVPVWNLAYPHPAAKETLMPERRKANIQYMAKELKRFVDFLEDLLKKKMDYDKLEAFLDNQEKVFKVWWEINELRKARPCPMHARDFWTLMVPCYYMSAEKETLDVYQAVYDEVKERVEKGIGAVEPEDYRLIFAELPPWHSLGFFEKLAELGWNFVTESPGYHPPPPMEFEEVGEPLERVARWTFMYYTHHFMHAQKMGYPMQGGMVQQYYNWAREYRCDGFLTHHLITCRTATFWLTESMNIIEEELGIPGMAMEGDIVDLTVFDPVAILDKAGPFQDTMDHYRKVRKEKGLDW
ncbi:2-hydroxyacyl-CoA dehydratase subunit D [Thermodesulfobacteriota bacterium]